MTGPVQQLTADDLTSMTPEQIVEAHQQGQLLTLITGQVPAAIPADGQLTQEHLPLMTPEQIVQAHEAGRLDNLLGISQT